MPESVLSMVATVGWVLTVAYLSLSLFDWIVTWMANWLYPKSESDEGVFFFGRESTPNARGNHSGIAYGTGEYHQPKRAAEVIVLSEYREKRRKEKEAGFKW